MGWTRWAPSGPTSRFHTSRARSRELHPPARQRRRRGPPTHWFRTPEGWHVDNTDVEGFLSPLAAYTDRIQNELAIVIGAGGAARAVAWACADQLGAGRVIVAARRREQANELAMALGIKAMTVEEAQHLARDAALVVNATPVGMAPNTRSTPWRFPSDLRSGHIAYDLVYRPAQTRFLRDAEAAGATCIGRASNANWSGGGILPPVDRAGDALGCRPQDSGSPARSMTDSILRPSVFEAPVVAGFTTRQFSTAEESLETVPGARRSCRWDARSVRGASPPGGCGGCP